MTYIKANGKIYPAVVSRRMEDYGWDSREVKAITLEMAYSEVLDLLHDNTPWSIIVKEPLLDDNGNQALDEAGNLILDEEGTEIDMSEYSMSGDITDHRDGTVTIKMGKPTDLENAYEMLIGGDE